MELTSIFLLTFIMIFIGELGDKTHIAAGTGTLANQKNIKIIFASSTLALVLVAGITVFSAGLIPSVYIPTIVKAGGTMLILYSLYLYSQAGKSGGLDEEDPYNKNSWVLFISHFSVVFIAELGDKTQIATLAIAIENQSYLLTVFMASATALATVTAITVWGVTKIPTKCVTPVQRLGAVLMLAYGVYMIF